MTLEEFLAQMEGENPQQQIWVETDQGDEQVAEVRFDRDLNRIVLVWDVG